MNRHDSPEWSDLQLFLTVMRCGSLTKAAAELGVSQPTLSRRIGALERHFGASLFHRTAPGLEPTSLARRIGEMLSPMEDAVARAGRAVAESKQQQMSLRLTTTATISMFLTEHISLISPASDGTCLDILASRRIADFRLHECDMAIRLRRLPPAGPITTRKLGNLAFAVYAARKHLSKPRAGLACVGLSDDRPPPQKQWFDAFVEEQRGRMIARLGEVHLRLAAVKAGVGASLLPCLLGDRESGLVRLTPPIPALTEEMFLLVHSDVSRRPAAREISAQIVRLFKDWAPDFAGLGTEPMQN
jgi:DNA-binding transcriptional LysR family regulator